MLGSRRLPPFLWHGTLFGAAAALSVGLSRITGGFAMYWIGTALLVAILLPLPTRRWWPTLAVTFVATIAITGFFGLGWRAAPIMACVNAVEATIVALCLRDAHRRTGTSLRWLSVAYLAGCLVGPMLSGIPAATLLSSLTGRPFTAALGEWMLSHALGFASIFPCAVLLSHARARRLPILPPPGRRFGAGLALGAMAIACAGCFGQSTVPMLFLPIMVLMYTMVLTDLIVSALALTMIIVCGVASAFLGIGPLRLLSDGPTVHFVFLQFYMACVSLAAVPIGLMLDRKRAQTASLAESEARYRLLADFSTDIIMVTTVAGIMRYISPSIRQLGDYEPRDLEGKRTNTMIASQHHGDVARAHNQVVSAPGTTANVEFLGITRSGETRWFESHMRAIVAEDGAIEGVCSVVRDISQHKRHEAELKAEALSDPLTGLANRRGFELFMKAAEPGCGYLALFDLDHFKRINDRYGHAAGDIVIKAFARAARSVVRDSDLVARIGGEEFVVHLHDATLIQAQQVCERIRAALVQEARVAVPAVPAVSASAGLSRWDGPLAEVMKRADAALYKAKAAGRDCLAIAA